MNPWLTAAIVLAAVAYVVAKRLAGEPLNARDLAGPPLVLTGIGIYQLTKITGLTGADYLWLAASIVTGIGLGVVRGTTIKLFTRDEVLWQRYSGRTFAVWIVSLVVSGGFGLLAKAGGMHDEARPLMLSIGVGMLGEMASLGLRALSTGRPFSPDRRDSRAAHQHLREQVGGIADRARATGGLGAGPDSSHSPTLRDSVGWLSDVARGTGDHRRR